MLHLLNHHADAVVEQLRRLQELGLFQSRFQRESARIVRVTIEETRAWINFEAAQALREREEQDRAHFGWVRKQFENKYEDPQDVILAAKRLSRARKGRKGRRTPGTSHL